MIKGAEFFVSVASFTYIYICLHELHCYLVHAVMLAHHSFIWRKIFSQQLLKDALYSYAWSHNLIHTLTCVKDVQAIIGGFSAAVSATENHNLLLPHARGTVISAG